MTKPLTNTDLDAWLQTFANEMPDVVHTTRRLLAALGDACELPPVARIEDNGTILLEWNVRGIYVNAEVGSALVEWCAVYLPTDTAVGEEGVLVPEAARDMRPWLRRLFDAYREQGPQQGSDA